MRRAVLALSMMLGCGPSFHAIYEGNARFEHCYALEESPDTSMRERADCWRDWSERYTYGQTRDRIQYAIARYVALSQAPNVPTDEALMMAAPGMTPRLQTIAAPAPTSPYAPPPKVLEAAEAGAEGGAAGGSAAERAAERESQETLASLDAAASPVPASVATPPPAASCSDGCLSTFHDCAGATDGGAKCGRDYKSCMRRCFK